ncbi:hypothetical protein E3J84_04490 [Candidatus Aerophobetes bacterium]|uniref:Uncharacterized protein n=1 Tax=Aerophobetes bacterium TaxID=2030807 RepID=A0A523RWH1_UNCAE|nr:MAG: hypothetical protein E3J84_04490 [Candidatus Aerophobetes bacterium]
MVLNEVFLILCIGIVLGLLLGMFARWLGRKLFRKKAILVICAWCQNEMRRSGIDSELIISHGICPECQKKNFPKKSPTSKGKISK